MNDLRAYSCEGVLALRTWLQMRPMLMPQITDW